MKKTLIIGASNKPERYAYKAAERLIAYGHEIELLGKRPELVFGKMIETQKKAYEGIDTITLYLSANYQEEYYDYILELRPKRVIFNPGTENEILQKLLTDHGIKAEEACTLVLLGTGQY
jgi:predicted CoA-binding protein